MTEFGEAPGTDPRSFGTRPPVVPDPGSHASGLSVALRPVESLDATEREAMWMLYSRFYAGSSRSLFLSDLDAKRAALLLHDSRGALQGFTTLAWWEQTFEGAPVRILFSGDTIIDRAHWGTQALAFNWLRFAGTLKRAAPAVPLYWFLIVKGQRTYRYLSAFARRFIPHWSDAEPAGWRRLLDALARERFGTAYDAGAGVVRFERSCGHLTPEWAAVSARELARPDVQCFLERNPGYASGDELACLCELSDDNLRPLARRVFGSDA